MNPKGIEFIVLSALFVATIPAHSQMISYERINQKALENSFDLKISKVDSALAQNRVREAKIAYKPTLVGNVSTEVVGGLGNANNPQNLAPVVVGQTILPGNSRFQNAIALTTSYMIQDFGARSHQLKAAKDEAQSAIIQQRVNARNIRLDVLDAFTEALVISNEIAMKKQECSLQDQLYVIKTRMNKAGRISRIDLGEQAIARSDAQRELQELQVRLAELLNKISSYTHEPYNVETVLLEGFETDDLQIPQEAFTQAWLPDFRAFQALIKAKDERIKAIRAKRLPQVSLFGSFVLYGSNKNNWVSSIADITARQCYFGINLSLPIYDAGQAKVEETHEVLLKERLALERDKAIWEKRTDFEKNLKLAVMRKVELKTTAQIINHSQDQLSMTIRLSDSQLVDKSKEITEQIGLLTKQLEEEKIRIRQLAAVKRLRIYMEAAQS